VRERSEPSFTAGGLSRQRPGRHGQPGYRRPLSMKESRKQSSMDEVD